MLRSPHLQSFHWPSRHELMPILLPATAAAIAHVATTAPRSPARLTAETTSGATAVAARNRAQVPSATSSSPRTGTVPNAVRTSGLRAFVRPVIGVGGRQPGSRQTIALRREPGQPAESVADDHENAYLQMCSENGVILRRTHLVAGYTQPIVLCRVFDGGTSHAVGAGLHLR